jgi:hypothetical protein
MGPFSPAVPHAIPPRMHANALITLALCGIAHPTLSTAEGQGRAGHSRAGQDIGRGARGVVEQGPKGPKGSVRAGQRAAEWDYFPMGSTARAAAGLTH